MDKRYGLVKWGKGAPRSRTCKSTWLQPLKWNHQAKDRDKVFCASLADVFDPEVPDQWRRDLFELIDATYRLDWLLLTKRPENVEAMSDGILPDNVWLGTSIEDQTRADQRIPALTAVPAPVHFLSVEPLLSPVRLELRDIEWVIVGGESGRGCRPFNVEWARDIRDQCRASDTSYFLKQLGGYPDKRHQLSDFPEDLRIREIPKESGCVV